MVTIDRKTTRTEKKMGGGHFGEGFAAKPKADNTSKAAEVPKK